MSIGQQVSEEPSIEGLIAQVRGVIGVRVVRNAQQQIAEIHVVGSPERSAKQMVRDIESIVYVCGGTRVDYRKISLVQIAKAPAAADEAHIQVLDIAYLAQDSTVATTLAMGDQRAQGVSRSGSKRAGQPEYLAAEAAIQALEQLLGWHGRLRLENLQRQSFGEIEVCLSHLLLIGDERTESLLGLSVVYSDRAISGAQAVVDAVNRRAQPSRDMNAHKF